MKVVSILFWIVLTMIWVWALVISPRLKKAREERALEARIQEGKRQSEEQAATKAAAETAAETAVEGYEIEVEVFPLKLVFPMKDDDGGTPRLFNVRARINEGAWFYLLVTGSYWAPSERWRYGVIFCYGREDWSSFGLASWGKLETDNMPYEVTYGLNLHYLGHRSLYYRLSNAVFAALPVPPELSEASPA